MVAGVLVVRGGQAWDAVAVIEQVGRVGVFVNSRNRKGCKNEEDLGAALGWEGCSQARFGVELPGKPAQSRRHWLLQALALLGGLF